MNEGRPPVKPKVPLSPSPKPVPEPAVVDPVTVESETDFMTPEYIRRRAERFATRGNETIAPPSLGDEFYDLSDEEMQAQYPARHARFAEQVQNVRTNTPPKLAQQRQLMQWFHMMNSLDRYVAARPTSETHEKALKPKQFFAVEKLRRFLERVGTETHTEDEEWNGDPEGFMVLPTGFGKTVMLAKIIEAMNTPPAAEASRDMREVARTRTLIVVPSLDLIPQTINQFAEFAPGLDVGAVSGKPKSRLGNHATVITYASFRNRVLDGRIKPSDFDVLVLDEAHEAITDLCKEAIDRFRGNAVILGVTATDEYDSEKNLTALLKNKICQMDLNDAVTEGLLSDFTAEVYNTHIDVSSVPIRNDGKYDPKEWEKRVNFRQRALVAARLYKERFAGQKLYLFCESITAAKITAEVFAEEGIPSASATSETEDDEHDQHWKDFNDGELLAFASVNQFIRGNDCKRAAVAMNLAPTGSKVRAQQRGGRVLRLDPRNPEKHAHVIDFLYTDKRGNPITFAQIAGREPIDITPTSRGVQDIGTLDATPDDAPGTTGDITAADLAESDAATVSDIELTDVVTIEAQRKLQEEALKAAEEARKKAEEEKRLEGEAEIFDTTITIERLYEHFATDPDVSMLERRVHHAVAEAVQRDDMQALQIHDANQTRLEAIARGLRDIAQLSNMFADEAISFGTVVRAIAEMEVARREIQLLNFRTQELFEEAAEIALEYGIDIIDLHQEAVAAK